MTFGEKLFQLRRKRGMSQEALAQELHVSRQAISRWELGEVAPDTGNVLAVSRLFGVSTDYLLRDECDREEDTPAVKHTEMDLGRRQREVGKGFFLRVFWLVPIILFQQGRISTEKGLDYTAPPILYLLILQVLFSALLVREYWRHHEQDDGWVRKLWGSDLLAAACVLVLPYLFQWIPGLYGVLLSILAACISLTWSVRQMRLFYRLPWGKQGRKTPEKGM